MKKRRLAFFAIMFSVISKLAFSAPMITSGILPISERDREKILAFVDEDKQRLKIFLNTLNQLRVYPDHNNPSSPRDIEDKTKMKIFWAAPLLSPSSERPTVGALAIAKDALKIVDEYDNLLRTIDVELERAVLLQKSIKDKEEAKADLEKQLRVKKDELGRRSIQNELTVLKNDINTLEKNSDSIRRENTAHLKGHSSSWIRRVIHAALRELARLGIVATEAERQQLFSDKYEEMNNGLVKLRARITRGQFAIQQVVLEAGLNQGQMEAFGFYSTLRPDVQIRPLNTLGLYVYEALQTADNLEENVDDGLPLMIKAINGGRKKAQCGAQSSCNIVMEYTEMGARWAQTSTVGTVILPVTFEADVEYEKPPFKGVISCDFKNGFAQKGRLDIKHGAVIYDGDVYDRVKNNTYEEGGCDFTTVGGSENDAKFFLLEKIFNEYVKIRTTRAQRSSVASSRERERLTKDIETTAARLRQRPPKNEHEYLVKTLMAFDQGNGIALATEVLSSLGQFFWQTKVFDTELSERVNIKDSLNHQKIITRERRAYDAFPVVCWKNVLGEKGALPFPVACSNEMLSTQNIQTITATGQEHCEARRTPDTKCGELVDSLVLHNPFGERFMPIA